MKLLEEIGAETELVVEDNLRRAHYQLAQAFHQNEKLLNALGEAREQIRALKDEVDKLCAPPSTYGVYLSTNQDATINIFSQGRKLKVTLHPSIDVKALRPGQELLLNDALNVVGAAGYQIQGDVVVLKERLGALDDPGLVPQQVRLRRVADMIGDLKWRRNVTVGILAQRRQVAGRVQVAHRPHRV